MPAVQHPRFNNQSGPDTSLQAGAALAVTPSNTEFTYVANALYVGTAGNVVAILRDDTTSVTFRDVPAGSILPFYVTSVLPATTASNIIALF